MRKGGLASLHSALLAVAVCGAFATSGRAQPTHAVFEGDLPRRAALGFRSAPEGPGGLYDAPRLAVESVDAGSSAARAGLFPGDVIASVNDQATPTALRAQELLGNVAGDEELRLRIIRGGHPRKVQFIPPPEPLENLRGVSTTYGVLTMADGTPLRTLLTRPLQAHGPLPAILLSDWTSCESVEVPRPLHRGWIDLVRGIVETTGMVVLRVDKPGTGDSRGFCSELDFDETLAYQKDALRSLKSRPGVDPDRVFVFGESVGSYLAPLVAGGEGVAGVFIYGGGALSWFERMVSFERKQRELSGVPLGRLDDEMKRIISFFHYYLIESLPLEAIFRDHPEMRDVWTEDVSYRSETKHYGRPIEFHQQAQRHDFARAWSEVNAPVLVLHGEYDQFESLEGARTIVRSVNRTNPGAAKLIVYPRMNHQLELYPTRESAIAGTTEPIVGAELVLADIREWLERR